MLAQTADTVCFCLSVCCPIMAAKPRVPRRSRNLTRREPRETVKMQDAAVSFSKHERAPPHDSSRCQLAALVLRGSGAAAITATYVQIYAHTYIHSTYAYVRDVSALCRM